jgi:hypothetical protein
MRKLTGLKKLRTLDLSRVEGYTDEGLAAVMRELPSLQVVVRCF